jgi:hypothetical protein
MLKNKEEALMIIHNAVWNSYTPHEAVGWPPAMLDHFRATMQNVAIAIVESIYTEEELDSKIESTLLDLP